MANCRRLRSPVPNVILLTTLVATAPAIAQNLLNDADVEQSLAGEEGGWIHFDGSRVTDEHARSGGRSIFNWGFSRTTTFPPYLEGRASGSYQEFPATPGSRWRLTGYAMAAQALKGYPAFGVLQISFFDAEGTDLGTVETEGNLTTRAKLSKEVNRESSVGDWHALDTGVATAPDGTATVQAFTLFVDYSTTGVAQGVHFDDLRLCRTDDAGKCVAR